MKELWFKGYKPEQKEARRKEVLRHKGSFEELKEVLLTHYKKKESVRDYELPNWEARQIAVNEYNHAIDQIVELISLDETP